MTIECYYTHCDFHNSKTNLDDGPFCYEQECKATPRELKLHGYIRTLELEKMTTAKEVKQLTGEIDESYRQILLVESSEALKALKDKAREELV